MLHDCFTGEIAGSLYDTMQYFFYGLPSLENSPGIHQAIIWQEILES